MMLTRNRLGLPQLAQKHLDRDDAPVRDAAHRRDGRRSRVRGQGTIHPGAFLVLQSHITDSALPPGC